MVINKSMPRALWPNLEDLRLFLGEQGLPMSKSVSNKTSKFLDQYLLKPFNCSVNLLLQFTPKPCGFSSSSSFMANFVYRPVSLLWGVIFPQTVNRYMPSQLKNVGNKKYKKVVIITYRLGCVC